MNLAWVFGHINVSTIGIEIQQRYISECAVVNGEIRQDSVDRNHTAGCRVRHDPFECAILEREVVIIIELICGIDGAIVEIGVRNVTKKKKNI
jgi:hypothetical protein